MPEDDLNEAIQRIKDGQPEQAQPILQSIIQANPRDLAAWSWYVKSCPTAEMRLTALEMCLKFNPGNLQVIDAIQKVQAKLSAVQPTTSSPSAPAAFQQTTASPVDMGTYTAVVAAIPSATSAIESVNAAHHLTGLDENPGRPFVWYDIWFRALTQANVDSYTELVRDPLARPGRAYWWVFMAGMVTGLVSLMNPFLISTLSQFEHEKGGANISAILAVILVVGVPFSAGIGVLALMLEAAIYSLLARLFGGSGNFSRTVYLIGAYTAPVSIITGILGVIPLVNCLTFLLASYTLWLNIVSIQAAQRLNGGRATIVVLLPSLTIIILLCLVLIFGGPALLKTLPPPTQPAY